MDAHFCVRDLTPAPYHPARFAELVVRNPQAAYERRKLNITRTKEPLAYARYRHLHR